MSIYKEIEVTRKRLDVCINVTYGSDLLPIELKVTDFNIPSGATAVAYASYGGKLKKIICDIENNTIIFTPEEGFFEVGKNELQLRVVHNNRSLFSFMCTVVCHKTFSDDDANEVKEQPTLVEELLSRMGFLTSRLDNILASSGDTEGNSELHDIRIGEDGITYVNAGTAVRNQIKKIKEELQSIQTEIKNIPKDIIGEERILELLHQQDYIKDIVENDSGFMVIRNDGEKYNISVRAGGISFDTGYQDENGYIHLTKDGEDVEGFTPFFIEGGGGGNGTGSKLKLSMYTASTFSVLDTEGTALIKGNFSSTDLDTGVDTGAGILTVSVGGVVRENKSVTQGDFEVDVYKYLNMGTNSVKLTMIDSYGTSVTRSFTVIKESFKITWSLSDTMKNSGTLSFYVTPSGSGDKTIYVKVDGKEYSSQIVSTSGRRLTISIPSLAHGAHIIEAYGEMTVNGAVLKSEVLKSAIAQVVAVSVTPIVAVKWPEEEIDQFTTIKIPYMVVDPMNNPATVSFLVNGEVYATEAHNQQSYTWDYRPTNAGVYRLGIRCGDILEEKDMTVRSLGSNVQEVTDGLEIKVEPATISNLANWNYRDYRFALSEEFDEVNGGLKTDDEGVRCIKIIKGDRLTLNYKLFGDDAKRKGKQFKVIYKVENSTKLNAEAISCKASGIGFMVRANDVQLSAEQTTISMDTCEGMKTEMDFNIQMDSESRLMSLWESVSTFQYAQYATNENFTQNNSVDITFGSDDCDVILYLFRAYNRELTTEELKANFAADGKDGAEIVSRHNRNQIYDTTGRIDLAAVASLNPNLHVWVWHSERMSLGKEDYVNGYLSQVYVAGGAGHQWTAYFTVQNVQGTSSVEHAATAGGNQDFEFAQGLTLEDGTIMQGYAMSEKAIPVMKLTYKKNIASQDHVTNSAMSEWYHRYQTSVRTERVENEGVRDCMESKMCVVFFHNTGDVAAQIGPDTVQPDETSFYGLGNICNSKDNVDAFKYYPIVIEVRNNTEPPVRFKSDDLSNFDTNFKYRYLDTTKYSKSEAQALFQKFVSFVHSCDYTEATNTALPQAVSYNGQTFSVDSPAYRKAKYKAEAPNYMDMSSILYHQNFTQHFLGRDSRGKNMFWSYNPETGKWSLIFCWDLDTFLGRNNEGHQDIQPGHLDTDTVGTKDVFNAADNVVFANNREVFMEELTSNYFACESAGAWDVDRLADYCDELQSFACEALWIEDMEHNDIRTLTNLGTNSYLPRAVGKERLRRRKYLKLQGAFINSYYVSTKATANSATFRGYTPSQWVGVKPEGILHITPYCNLFVNVHIGSSDLQLRGYAGEEVEVALPGKWNDSEGYIRSAEWIQSLGDMAPLYIGDCNLSPMTRLTRAEIGSSVEGYFNTNFETAAFQNCKSLEYVNLGGLTKTEQSYDFSSNLMLKEIYTKGSGVTGLKFAKNGRLETARINGVASIELSGLKKLRVFEMESYEKLSSLTIENCPVIDSYSIVNAACSLARVRLLDINWNVPVNAYEVLMRINNLQGIDDDGYNTEKPNVRGEINFTAVSETKLNEVAAAFPNVVFTFESLLEEHTVTTLDGDGTVLYTQKVEHGGNAIDPVAAGLVKIPTKNPTVEIVYNYAGQDRTYNYITEDVIISPLFKESTRYYSVTFVERDGTVLEEHSIPVYGSCEYGGDELSAAGEIWMGFDKVPENVVEDMLCTAMYVYPTVPGEIKDLSKYEYVYSDNPNDNMAYTFGELAGIIKAGQVSKYIHKTALIKMCLSSDVITEKYIEFALHAVGHYELVDGGASNADFYMAGSLDTYCKMNDTATNYGGWDLCKVRTWLNEVVYPTLPYHWRWLIAKSKTLASAGNQSLEIVESEDFLRIPSIAEVGYNTTTEPYCDEVWEEAEEIAFAQYTDNSSRIKYTNSGYSRHWWTRSADVASVSAFRGITNNGINNSTGATGTYYVVFGFSA